MTAVQLSEHPNWPKGLRITFPWSQQAVDDIKKVLGTNWHPATQKNLGYWEAKGPEIILEFERIGITIQSITPKARELCEEFRDQVWAAMDARMLPIDKELWGYQHQGSAFLSSMPNCILGDDMGTGKSKQSLDACYAKEFEHILIVCNKTATYNWLNEVKKWNYNYTAGVVPEGGAAKRKEFWKKTYNIVIANYEVLWQPDWPMAIAWDALIADEATRFKNSGTRTWKAINSIANKSRTCWALTGTPLEKNLDELYNIMAALRPAVLGNFSRFRLAHMELDAWSGKVIGIKDLPTLRERIGPFMLRRTKAEVQKNLPLKSQVEKIVPLSVKEQEAYESFTEDFDNWLGQHGISGGADPMIQTLRMRQFTCTPMIFTTDLGYGSKMEALADIVDEWEGQIVVFCSLEQALLHIQSYLGTNPEAFISGAVDSAEERFRRVELFNAGQLGKVFLSTDAGNQSINLTGADLIIHYDQIWNPQKMHQREDRLHRIGQLKPVTVIHLMCKDTIDIGMFQRNREEEQTFVQVVDGAEEVMLKKLNAPRWKDLVRGRTWATATPTP